MHLTWLTFPLTMKIRVLGSKAAVQAEGCNGKEAPVLSAPAPAVFTGTQSMCATAPGAARNCCTWLLLFSEDTFFKQKSNVYSPVCLLAYPSWLNTKGIYIERDFLQKHQRKLALLGTLLHRTQEKMGKGGIQPQGGDWECAQVTGLRRRVKGRLQPRSQHPP